MANVTETASWESGIYRIETTDPILGGETGTANIQARQLANRTLWLKARADQVDAASSGYGSLQARLTYLQGQVESVGADMVNMDHSALMEALMQINALEQAIDALRYGPWQAQGEASLTNRGVVRGCTLSKSTTATRNLNIDGGVVFAHGRTYDVSEGANAASVPSNTGSGAVTVRAYLYPHADGSYRLAVTAIGQDVPADAIHIYNLTIPANNTDATDPYLANVTLTSVRRIEADWPVLMTSEPNALIALSRPMRSNAYAIEIDPVSWTGPQDAPELRVVSRAPNGFTVALYSAHDAVTFRWRAIRLND